MTLDEKIALAERVPELERRLADLERQLTARAIGYTLKEISESILPGVPVSTLREWIKSGELVAVLTPGEKVYLVPDRELRAFMERLKRREPAQRRASVEEAIQGIVAATRKKAG
jgi:excisionase family DNA binding protein